jgi:RNA polymerase sigma-70 factor (ECF subfamily)
MGRRGTSIEEIERIYRERFPQLVQVARAMTGDRERAVEAVQEAFANAIRARGAYRGDGSLEAWIWRAVVNAARQSLRRPLVEVGRETEAAYAPAPETADVAPLVSRLPERQRLIVFLRYYADLDYRTIAATLDLEVGTVSSSLAAAHAAIRKSIRQVGSDA